jgi:asparagine synthase (glutamine-hydrolysing)
VCGIAGLLDPEQATTRDQLGHLVVRMASELTHRGPDGSGEWIDPDGRVALGFRRLAIVELSSLGDQPMASADGRWVIVYNGEIYNFAELRRQLVGQGLVFRGGSDTEVLVNAVQCWGLDRTLEASEGMFAFALWDRHRRELHLARDRFGEKPLYYGWVDRRLVFASELKALSRLPGFAAELDRDSVARYLRHNCIPAPNTVYRGMVKLEPGKVVTFDGSTRPGALPTPRMYWSPRSAVEEARRHQATGSVASLTDQVEDALSASVAARMVADVPVGAFLSGGVDSSLVVALMQQLSSSPVRTFTVGFADREFNESNEATAVAAHLKTEHTVLDVGDGEASAVIPRLPEIWDEPFGDISQIPVFLVSRLARSQVTVSLSGDGGDELFAGYNRHAWLDRLWRRSAVVPPVLRRWAGSAMVRVPPGAVEGAARVTQALPARWQLRNPSTKVVKMGKVLAATSPEDAYLALISHWEDPASMVLGSSGRDAAAPDPADWPALSGITEQMLWLDLIGYLPDDILTKLDRAAMATSLETRVPFLDRRVFDLAWSLPLDTKLRGGVTKWILRQVLYRHVPPALVDRPKMGFGLPIGSWLRGPLRPWAEELLDQRRLRLQGLLDPAPVRAAWRQHLSGRRDLGYELWDVLALQAWLDHWMPGLGR